MSRNTQYPLRSILKDDFEMKGAEKRRKKLRASGGADEPRRRWVRFDLTEVGSSFSNPGQRQRASSSASLRGREEAEREKAWKIKRQKIYDAIDQREGISYPRPSTLSRERTRSSDAGDQRQRIDQPESSRLSRTRTRSRSGEGRTSRWERGECGHNRISSRSGGMSVSGRSESSTSRRASRSRDGKCDERGGTSSVSNNNASRRTKTNMSNIERWIRKVGSML